MDTVKPMKYSVALVIYNEDGTKYMITRRPLDDDSLPGFWGFPAGSKKTVDEPWEDVVHRVAKIKLGIEVRIVKILGEETVDRGGYIINLRDYIVEVTKGKPAVPQIGQEGTQYMELKWTDEKDDLIKAAKAGGLCSRAFLTANGVNWKE